MSPRRTMMSPFEYFLYTICPEISSKLSYPNTSQILFAMNASCSFSGRSWIPF